MPQSGSSSFSARLRELTAEIQSLDRELKSNAFVKADDLREFRHQLDNLRMTAWTVNELMHAREARKDPGGMLRILTAERLRRFRQMVQDVCGDLERDGSSWPSHMRAHLQESASLLRQQLALPASAQPESEADNR